MRTDFTSHCFPASRRLFELADYIEEIKTRCHCGKKASINARFNENGDMVLHGTQIMVGGNDIYKPMCRKCWFEKVKEMSQKQE